MNVTEFSLSYETVAEQSDCMLPVIVVAAGLSSRMNGIDKQLMPICGIPLVVRTLRALEASRFISRIILVMNENNIDKAQALIDQYKIGKISDIVCGGESRSESVMKGIERLTPNEKKVLIHDGARPLINDTIIGGVANALQCYDCAVCAVKVNDTVKSAHEGETVDKTVDRTDLYLAQTPQGVDIEKYKTALQSEALNGVTDDSQIMEIAGYSVKITEGSRKNIKITTVDDIEIAESFIKGEN